MKGTSSSLQLSPCSDDDDDDDDAHGKEGSREELGFVVDMAGREGVSVAVAMAMEMLVLMVAMAITPADLKPKP